MKPKSFLTVFSFEYFSIVKTKLFIILTAVIILVIGAALTIPPMITSSSDSITDVPTAGSDGKLLIVDKASVLADTSAFEEALPSYELVQNNDLDISQVKESVNNGEYDYVLFIEEPLKTAVYEKRYSMDGTDATISAIYASQYKLWVTQQYGLSEEATLAVMSEPTVEIVETDKGMMDTYFYTYFLMMLLYMTIAMYGQMVANSVASEKSSRAMELLITSADPNSLLFGKILGAGCAGLTQISLILLSCIGFFNLNSQYWENNQIMSALFNMPTDIIVYTILFFTLGFFSYAALYGALGSMVSRSEDVNVASMPVTFLFVFAFMISVFALTTPDTLFVRIMSFIPFFSQMVMFVRVCVSTVSVIEIVISLILLAVTAVGTAFLSAKIYRLGTITYGKVPNMKNIFAMLNEDRRQRKGK